jgi:hypothetical protein
MHEEPLFSPTGNRLKGSTLVANIGGELSLWNMRVNAEDSYIDRQSQLRVYSENGYGWWVDSNLMSHLREATKPNYDEKAAHRARTIMRHIDQISVYAAMLGVDLTE